MRIDAQQTRCSDARRSTDTFTHALRRMRNDRTQVTSLDARDTEVRRRCVYDIYVIAARKTRDTQRRLLSPSCQQRTSTLDASFR
jgi:hypothetical protein